VEGKAGTRPETFFKIGRNVKELESDRKWERVYEGIKMPIKRYRENMTFR